MVQNPPEGYHRVTPYLLYTDVGKALEFICSAFGFTERMRVPGADGSILHAEADYEGHIVMMGMANPEMGAASCQDLPAFHSTLMCYVDDVDAHFARAKAAGAKIVQDPADQFYGDRTYRAEDIEGQQWSFHTHVKDIAPEDMEMPGG